VNEGWCKVYILFGKVLGVVDQPGLHLLWLTLGPQAALVRLFGFGRVYDIDLRLDQEYLRSNPVNSEEGTPMGVGVWYEMRIKNPVELILYSKTLIHAVHCGRMWRMQRFGPSAICRWKSCW
jgi:hypothetical protein